MQVLVTGGAGYIGSHACVALLEAGHDVIVIDNLCNGSEVALQRVQQIAGKSLQFLRGDILNPDDLERVSVSRQKRSPWRRIWRTRC